MHMPSCVPIKTVSSPESKFGRDQFVVVRHAHGDDAARGGIVEVLQGRLLHRAIARRHDDEDIRGQTP